MADVSTDVELTAGSWVEVAAAAENCAFQNNSGCDLLYAYAGSTPALTSTYPIIKPGETFVRDVAHLDNKLYVKLLNPTSMVARATFDLQVIKAE